ncbi:hypothetical protein SLA2020_156060 [Shorea laevis]
MEVIEISSSSPEKETDGTPVRSIFCLKRRIDMERIDLTEDCFVLDFNPFDSFGTSNISGKSDSGYAPDLSVIAEKGQVACRDYPHSRHLCLSFPFETTPHEKYCELCYCYVCDSAAPCKYWTVPNGTHCHALDVEENDIPMLRWTMSVIL